MFNECSTLFIGYDDGNAQHKISAESVKSSFPTHIQRSTERFAVLDETFSVSSNAPVQTKFTSAVTGNAYTIGEVKQPIPRNDDFSNSEAAQVLLQHGLNQFGDELLNKKYVLCTGMPLRQFFKTDGSVNENNVKQKMLSMQRSFDHLGTDPESKLRKSNIEALLVQPEALAALRVFLFKRDDSGMLVHNPEFIGKTIAIADPGGKTTDIAVFDDGTIDMDRSVTQDIGFNQIVKKASNYLYDLGFTTPTHQQCRKLIDEGIVTVRGVEKDHSKWAENARKELASKIFGAITDTLSKAVDIDLIIFIGGTIAALREEITPLIEEYYGKDNNSFLIPDEADKLNARGLELFAELWYQNNNKNK